MGCGGDDESPAAFFLVPFMCVWSGGSLGGIYGSRIARGQFNLEASLFGIPFVLGTLLFGSIAVMSLCGKAVVRVRGDEGVVFVGVGAIGWRRRFRWGEVTRVMEGVPQSKYPGQEGPEIRNEGKKTISSGAWSRGGGGPPCCGRYGGCSGSVGRRWVRWGLDGR